MVEVIVKLPENVARTFGETPEAIGRQVAENAAIEAYRTGRLIHRQVGEMLGFDYWQSEEFFLEHGVPLNYTVADLETDRPTLDKLFNGQ